jgi:hypothetical protein
MSTLPARLNQPKRGSLELLDFDGKEFRLRSPEPFAPGQPLTLTVGGLTSEHYLELKSLGSVKRDNVFEIRARASTLRKEAREALLAHFQR